MKRSKMVEKLKKHLRDNFDYYNLSYKDNSENILKFLEYEGMLPPYSDKVFQKNYKKDRYPLITTGNEWDEE